MMYPVTIGHSEVKVNPLGLGTNAVGGYNLFPDLDDQAGIDLVKTALDNGINLLDTAYVYGLGHSEELIGQAIQDYDRHKIIIATKGAHDFSTGKEVINNDPDFITKQVNDSLKRLQTDYIDIYYLHFPDHDTPKAEAVGALQELREEGKIRAIGISNFSLAQIKEANTDGYVDIVEDEFSLLHQDHLMEGMLNYLHADDIRSQIADFKEPRYSTILDAVDLVRPIADRHHATIAQIILAWYLQNPLITAVIPGAKNARQVLSNAQAMKIELSTDEYQTIEQAFNQFKQIKSGKSLKDPD